MPESISTSATLKVSAEKLFKAWLDSREHTAFTGDEAVINPKKGGKFTAWGGYISGKTVEVEPFRRIVQSWRTTEFDKKDPDSTLEIIFEESKGKTKITLNHSNIPNGQAESYKKGWDDFYFKPMKEYFVK